VTENTPTLSYAEAEHKPPVPGVFAALRLLISSINAEKDTQAEVRSTSKPFRADLTVLENEGHLLWNGRDEIFTRKALPAEEAQVDASQTRTIQDKEIDEDDDWLMFLVPVTDPTDDFDPYDGPGAEACRCAEPFSDRPLHNQRGVRT
jgi:hypothetical protein